MELKRNLLIISRTLPSFLFVQYLVEAAPVWWWGCSNNRGSVLLVVRPAQLHLDWEQAYVQQMAYDKPFDLIYVQLNWFTHEEIAFDALFDNL